MNVVVLGIGFVIVLANQRVTGLGAYPVVVLIGCLRNKRLIQPKVPKSLRQHGA